MLNIYFVFVCFNSISNVSFYADDNRYGVPTGRGSMFAKEFSAQEMEEFFKAELCRVREEATLYVSKCFDPAMVQRVVGSLNQRGWNFHLSTGSSDLPGLEIISRCNCRDYEP